MATHEVEPCLSRRQVICGSLIAGAGLFIDSCSVTATKWAESTVNSARVFSDREKQRNESRKKFYQTAGWIGLGTGATLAVIGTGIGVAGLYKNDPKDGQHLKNH